MVFWHSEVDGQQTRSYSHMSVPWRCWSHRELGCGRELGQRARAGDEGGEMVGGDDGGRFAHIGHASCVVCVEHHSSTVWPLSHARQDGDMALQHPRFGQRLASWLSLL